MEGIAIIFVVVALLLGRWWRVTLPTLVLVAIMGWIWLYEDTDGALYGDGRQDDGFWVIAGCASVFAVVLGVVLHQISLAAVRSLRR